MLSLLSGKWFLLYSNFKMWHRPGIADVTFNYTATHKNGQPCLLDEVKYVKHNNPHVITGYDYLQPGYSNRFMWQGKGWLFIAKSNWQIEWVSDDEKYIVISFEKTLFTQAGVDVICRHVKSEEDIVGQALAFISGNAMLKDKAMGLKKL